MFFGRARVIEVTTLARGCVMAGVVCAMTTIVPFSPTAPRVLSGALAVAGLALGWALWRLRRLCPAMLPHLVLLLATALIGAAIASATTPMGMGVTAMTFVWIAVYTAAFHDVTAILAHLAAMAGALAGGLALAAAPSSPQTWLFVVATVSGVAWLLHHNVRVLRLDAAEDPLTGAVSRRRFLEIATREIERARKVGGPVTLALIDLDDFKRVNDEGGHAAGDAALVDLVHTLRRGLRSRDVLARLGGDEFALVLPGVDLPDAQNVLRRLQEMETTPWTHGAAQWSGEPLERWIARADRHLYAAKKDRRPTTVPLHPVSAVSVSDATAG